MEKNSDARGEAAMELQQNYLDMLRRRVGELHRFADRCLEGQLTADEIEEIHLRVHSLVGSGATYGHSPISEAAQPLNQALSSPTSSGLKTLSGLAARLIETCTGALATPEKRTTAPGTFKKARAEGASSRHVLLTVDDDPAIHDLVKAIFRDSAHIVTAYNSGEALDAVHRHCPDLVLLDNYMPGTDGLKFLETLGDDSDLPPVPVIMLTATTSPQEILRAAAAGAVDYIAKPFEPRILADKINGLIRRGQITVLLANGSTAMRGFIAIKLRRMGFNVLEAASGRQALAIAREHIPELILLDQSMPEMQDGAVLHSLRKDRRTRHIPMLYATVDHQGQSVLEGFNTGAMDRVVMPFAPEKVTARIMDVLGMEMQWA